MTKLVILTNHIHNQLRVFRRIATQIMDQDSPHLGVVKSQLLQLYKSAVVSVLPGNLIKQQVRIVGNELVVNGNHYGLTENVYVVGFGKAVEGMAVSLENILGERLRCGVLSLPTRPKLKKLANSKLMSDPALQELQKEIQTQFVNTELARNQKCSVLERLEGAENNQPDENSLAASNKIVKLVRDLGKNDTLIVLISGGGSALLVQPREPLTLDQKRDVTSKLQAAGADIGELNHTRKLLSSVKGGGLARLAHPANVICLILSDVIGDDCTIIASGPTCPLTPLEAGADPAEEVISILKRYKIFDSLDDSVIRLLESSFKIDDAHLVQDNNYLHVVNLTIGNNATALKAAEAAAKVYDLKTLLVTRSASGDVSQLSFAYAVLVKLICLGNNGDYRDQKLSILNSALGVSGSDLLKIVQTASGDLRNGRGLVLLGGGEPTVNVKGCGKGGRNQELALTFSLDWLAEVTKEPKLAQYHVLFLSAGTDGQDGPTDATGAFGRSAIKPLLKKLWEKLKKEIETVQTDEELDKLRCKLEQIELMVPENVLKRNDSYNFFSRFENGENHLLTGLTGTNVMDLHFIYISYRERNQSINLEEALEENILKFI